MTNSSPSLDTVLDRLVESYEAGCPLSRLETAALPNRQSVLQAFHHLQHLLFLGFFTTRPLAGETLRLALGEHLLAASELLEAQVRRAAAWDDRDRAPAERRSEAWCHDCVLALMDRLPALRELLRGDVEAMFRTDPAAESLEEVVFSYPGVLAMTAYRVGHELYKLGVPLLPRILTEHAHQHTGIDIHPGARIGQRFAIDHGTGLVVGATTDIGDDVRLFQGVTLGALTVRSSLDRSRDAAVKRHPTLEDGVTVYAGATILGGDTVVGAGSVVGGNVWLTHSVAPRTRVTFRPIESKLEAK